MFRLGLWSGEVDYDIFIFYVFLRSYDYNEFTFAIAGFPAYLPMFSLPKVNIFVETNSKFNSPCKVDERSVRL